MPRQAALLSGIMAVMIVAALMFTISISPNQPVIAQGNPTDQQMTIDAVVNQRFQETAQAGQQLAITQTIDAVFRQAMTATAEFQGTVDASFNQAITATAQASRVDWNLRQFGNIEQVVGNNLRLYDLRYAVVSPDGEKLIWSHGHELCLFSFEGRSVNCYEIPRAMRSFLAESLNWSPDSRYVTFTEDWFTRADESDIWILEVETGVYQNLTDDGKERDFFRLDNFSLDYWPVWHPTSGDIYFFRTVRNNGFSTISLQSINPVSGIVTVAADLNGFSGLQYFDQSAATFSSDGLKFAFVVSIRYSSTINGLWILNLADNSLEQVATLEALCQGVPYWQDCSSPAFVPVDIVWAANDAGLVVSLENLASSSPSDVVKRITSYVNLNDGRVLPLVDLGDVDSMVDFFALDSAGHTKLYEIMDEVAVAPDGYTLFFYHADQSSGAISKMSLPPDGSQPVELLQGEFNPIYRIPHRILRGIASNGRMLLAGYVIDLQTQ